MQIATGFDDIPSSTPLDISHGQLARICSPANISEGYATASLGVPGRLDCELVVRHGPEICHEINDIMHRISLRITLRLARSSAVGILHEYGSSWVYPGLSGQ